MFLTKSSKSSFLAGLFLLAGSSLFAQNYSDDYTKTNQPKENSPFSRLGFGNLVPQSLVANGTFGGLTAAYQDRFNLNPHNPAALGALRAAVYEVGVHFKSADIKSSGIREQSLSGNISYLALGFPTYSIINDELEHKPRVLRWSMGFSLLPYNTVGYNIGATEKHPSIDTAQIVSTYIGTGGTYRIMWGNAVTYKNLSVGINAGYLFGNMGSYREVLFQNLDPYYGNIAIENYSVRGFAWNAGAQYKLAIDKKQLDREHEKFLILGVYGNSALNFSTDAQRVFRRLGSLSIDTLINETNKGGSGVLPSELTMGAMYEHTNKFRIGFDYSFTNWSEYKNTNSTTTNLKNSTRIGVGLEYTPEFNSYKSYWRRISYRAGFQTFNDPRTLNGEQLKGWTLSAGFGFPITLPREQYVIMNIGFDLGNLSVTNKSEEYYRINLGFTLNDNTWFLKRRYN